MKHVHVAAGILRDTAGRILIAERLSGGPLHGRWEFPGGKIVPGETPVEALYRELAEELGIQVTASEPFMDVQHDYPDRRVNLEFFIVSGWRGVPVGLEGQQISWVVTAELDIDLLLPADVPVVEALRSLSVR
jgi:8-oxo-dGTP diphosphatase